MKITIDVSPAVHRRAGLGRYAQELVDALAALDEPWLELGVFFTEAGRAEPVSSIAMLPQFRSRLGYKPWRLAAMASHFARVPLDRLYESPDVIHATDHLLPHVNARSVFTLHDLIFELFPEHHKFYNHTFLKLMMRRFLERADQIIAVSEHTKRDAMRLYGIPAEKMTVIYEGVNPRFQPANSREELERVRQRYELPEQFVLHVGTIEPRKNLRLLLDAFGSLKGEFPDLKLVLVGKRGWLYEPFFEHLAASGLEGEVIFPGFVEEGDLPRLYELASVFVFPSVYEGFGLPPLEAMACGTPVIVSEASSLPEVVGDAGLLVPPDDEMQLTKTMRRVLSDAGLRQRLEGRGLQRATMFSWERAAKETVDVYRSVQGRR